MYYANEAIKGETVTETIFDWADGIQTSDKNLEYKGKVENGKLILHANGEVAVCVDDGEHYAYKNKDSDEVISGNGTCVYDGTTGEFSSNSSINDLRGKTLVATSITQSADGLNAVITIPEEGHYDGTSKITVPIETIKNEVSNLNNVIVLEQQYLSGYNVNTASTSWNITSVYDDYQNLTIDNFYTGVNGTQTITHFANQYVNIAYTKSYNAETGVFTMTWTSTPEKSGTWFINLPIQPIIIL